MNSKKIIPIAIILLIIIIAIISILILQKPNNDETDEYGYTPPIEDIPVEIHENIKEVTVRNNYYIVKNCINKFFMYYSHIYNVEDNIFIDEEAEANIENLKKKNIEVVYSLLDEKYKTYKNITLDNLSTKLSNIKYSTVKISNMYVTEKDENISVYFVDGFLLDKTTFEVDKFSIMVNIDMLNKTFTVLLEDYIKEFYPDIKVGDNIEIDYSQGIEENTYNEFEYESISDETYISDVFNNLKENMIYNNSMEIYNNLDETYKKERFPTIDSFNKYVEYNKKKFVVSQLSQYKKTKYDDYTQYVCLTNKNEYYIIKEYSPTECKFILDTYTIDLPEFVEKYNSATEQIKVGMNVEKVIEAINEKDYQYVYNKLDDTFKNNNYQTLNKFSEYIENNLYSNNKVEYTEFTDSGDTYIYKLKVKNTDNEKSTVKNLTIIMKLLEGTDFVMSFNIK